MNWMRKLSVSFSNGINKLTVEDLNIDVEGYKYLSALKDACTIKISNLDYQTVLQILNGKYYEVEVVCGYKNGNQFIIFKGGILHISNSLDDRKTHTMIILCGSELVARFSQKRLNLTINSGLNVYTALYLLSRAAGVNPNKIGVSVKELETIIQEPQAVNSTLAAWIEEYSKLNENVLTNSDSSLGSVFTLADIYTNPTIIDIANTSLNLDGGYPRLNSQGLQLTVMASYPYQCGNIITVDNSIINISTTNYQDVNGLYLDNSLGGNRGAYVIMEINYHLQNRGSDFSMTITGKSKALFSKVTNE